MSDARDIPFLSLCPVCEQQIDVTAMEPFSKVACPSCGQLVRVRRNFDHFRIIKQIGEGGMSRVFEAEDETLGRRVALKILNKHYSRDAVRVEQFKREAQVTARLSHLHVIKLYSTGEDHGYFYIAMELVGGGSLEQRIRNLERLEEIDVMRIGREVGEGLRAAQKIGLIHRDVKPANILFTDTGTAKVVDFGLAIFAGTENDDDGEIWATPFYVAPEKVIDNREDYRSDIFSLGATLFHALTGKPPHKANTNSLSELRKIKARRVLLEDTGMAFSARTTAVVNRMLAVSPDDRHPDYDAVVEDLRVAERMVGRRPLMPGTRRQKMMLGAAGALLTVLLVGWLGLRGGAAGSKVIRGGSGVEVELVSGGGVTLEAGRETVGDRFRQARETLMEGRMAEARGQFELLIRQGLRQPTLNWARYHAAVCAVTELEAKTANQLFKQMQEEKDSGGNAAETLAFFHKLGERLSANPLLPLKATDLGYGRASEEVMGYLMHGLVNWHLADPMIGLECLETFLDAAPLLSTSGGISTSLDWIPPYAQAIRQQYAGDMDIARTLPSMTLGADATANAAGLKQLEEMRSRLRSGGAIRELLTRRIQEFKRDLMRQQLADREKSESELRERRQRELEQLQEMTSLLPSLASGYDYTPVLDVLESIRFETREVRSALEGKLYLYSRARDFIDQLGQDIAAQSWTGPIRRTDGTTVEGTVTTLDRNQVTFMIDRGSMSIPTPAVQAETLVAMATAYTARVRDSRDYYRRMELTAVFARVAGLPTVSAMIAAPLMEENRDFRMRWLKVL